MLKDILAISGKGGLFQVVSQSKSAIIVESLVDGKRMPTYATSKISALDDISVYTVDGDVKLVDVLKTIFDIENGGNCIDSKASDKELKAYFLKVMPNYDSERVYISDIKKVLMWYNLLNAKQLLKFDDEVIETVAEEVK